MEKFAKKKLPVGIENFEEIRKEGFYYIDKSGMIRDLLERWGKVNLFTRPRRFGKSLNMSMLKSFFETGSDPSLFDGLEISKETVLCDEYMGKFPVIFITLKGVNGADYATARSLLCSAIGNEAMRFQFLLDDDKLTEREKEQYRQLVNIDVSGSEGFFMSDVVLMGSLKILSVLLEKHYNRKVILLIDEYDVPLAKADEQGYYSEMILLIRNMFEQVLKTNDSLYFAVLTGCLRVTKESIFTGLNNMKIFSITNVHFDEYFGFTDREVRDMLSYYELEECFESVKNWYDGYLFGDVEVYCPWDVISYCDEAFGGKIKEPKNYWTNTSGNDSVRHFIEKMGNGVMRAEMEALIAGETVEKEIHEDLTYNRHYDTADNIWSVLFMTGYLTQRGEPDGDRFKLAVPNMEIRSIFVRQIMSLFKSDVAKDGARLKAFCDALQRGDAREVEKLFESYLKKTISIRDTFFRRPIKENFYHGLLLGILGYKNDWYVKSNKESGNGYGDICILVNEEDTGIVIEVKYAEERQFESVCRDAILQIDKNGYADELKNEGCLTILKYGIACCRKECRVVVESEKVS